MQALRPVPHRRSCHHYQKKLPGAAARVQAQPIGRRRAACAVSTGRDAFLESMELMDRQMALMDQRMDMMSREMDADVSRMFGMARQMERDALEQADRALSQARQGGVIVSEPQPGVQIRRSEERGPHSYRYVESITISSGVRYTYPPTPTTAAVGPSPLLFVAAVLAGAWAAAAAAFARNFHLTTYQERSKWLFALLWPVLVLASRQFREQFLAAVRGIQAKSTTQDGGATASRDGV